MADRSKTVRSSREDTVTSEAALESPVLRRQRRASSLQLDWRASQVAPNWGWQEAAVTLAALGLSFIASKAIAVGTGGAHPLLSIAALWLGLTIAITAVFWRRSPRGLLHFRATDIIWGIAGGVALRIAQGLLSSADASPFPALTSVERGDTIATLASYVLQSGLIAPLIEEVFFRGLVMVFIFQQLSRMVSVFSAACTSIVAAALAFVALHGMYQDLRLPDAMQLFLFGIVCGVLVFATGRVFTAVMTHAVFNLTFLSLVWAGMLLA